MIPNYNNLINMSFTSTSLITSDDYKLNHKTEKYINGKVEKLQAMEQVVFKILNTQRYNYAIYSWNYGVELQDLYGKEIEFVCAELQRRITEALLQDDRINDVSDFDFDTNTKGIASVNFVVWTIFGTINAQKEVDF